MKKVLGKLFKFIDMGITALMIICCIFVILWVVSPIRDYLIACNIFSSESYIGFVTSISILSVGLLWSIKYKTNSMDIIIEKAVNNAISEKKSIIQNGIHDIYVLFDKVLIESENNNENVIDIIGSTLYTAWPHIHPWLLKDSTMQWTINLFILDPSYIKKNRDFIDKNWKYTSQNFIEQIKSVCTMNKEQFIRKNITVNLFSYSYFPSVRGFKINENILITYSHWSADGLADYPHYFYEYFKATDTSVRAECYKSLYNNTLSFYKDHSTRII